MDPLTLKDLPLPIAVILICFYFLNQNNAQYSKLLVALATEFTGKYDAAMKTVLEERKAWGDYQTETNRQLMIIAREATEAQVKNANESHALRNVVQPLVLTVQESRRRAKGSGGGADAAD